MFVQADLNKVIARTQGANLILDMAAFQARVFARDILETARQPGIKVGHVLAFVSTAGSQGDTMLYLPAYGAQIIGQVVGGQRQFDGVDAATDVHSNRSRDNRLVRGNNTTDGRADAHMNVRHGYHSVWMHKGQGSDIMRLVQGGRIDIVRPDFDGTLILLLNNLFH